MRESLEKELKEIEEELANSVSKSNFEKIKETLSQLESKNGSFSSAGLWKAKQKIVPKYVKPLPVAKIDSHGRLVSDPEELKQLYINTYIHRLRQRPIRPGYQELEVFKNELFNKRMQLLKMQQFKPWKLKDLRFVLRSLKKNKSRDPHGLINELFRPENIGSDMEVSILNLLNKIKQNLTIPDFMQFANIVSIYKGKKSRCSLENDRGIFIINIFRSILMKIIYNEEYETIDSHMSDSNIGARKEKNIRNHIFILNGIINEVNNNKNRAIDVVILDYKQCFDGMWLQDSLNDLYDAGVKDRNLAIIYEANRKNKVAVKTPNDITDRIEIENLVMQGETLAPLECSVSVDSFGKECQEEEKYLFYYRDSIGIPSLAMIDDLVCISDCGLESVKLNAFINAKSNSKKFQFGTEKCHKLHFGRKNLCPDLYLDTWKIQESLEVNTGKKVYNDKADVESKIKTSEEEKYLGDVITNDGKNTKNIAARRARGIGIVDKIFTYLDEVFLGPFYYQAALMFRTSLLFSSILLNSESWYNITESDLQQLESVDHILHRKLLESPRSTPINIMHLELGTLPIRFEIKKRRVLFLQYILKQNKDDLIYKFFKAQLRDPSKGDWVIQVKKDLIEINLDMPFENIEEMSKNSFKIQVKEAINKTAFNWLMSKIRKKGSEINYSNLKLQDYFIHSDWHIAQCNLLFVLRAHITPVKCNYCNKFDDLSCPICMDPSSEDSQLHLLYCKTLFSGEYILVKNKLRYTDIYSSDVQRQAIIVRFFEALLRKRRKLLSQESRRTE